MSNDVIKLSHTMRDGTAFHNVKDILDVFSKSDCHTIRVQWDSGVSLLKAQQVVSKGINYYGYSKYIGTKTDAGHLLLYKKLQYGPRLLMVACYGKLAYVVAQCLRSPDENKKELKDIADFCRWASNVHMQEAIASAILHGRRSVALSLERTSSNDASKLMRYVHLMQYECYINSTGNHLIITL